MIVLRGLLQLVDTAIFIYSWVVVARVFISWVDANPYNQVVRILHSLTEPVLAPIRRVIPPFRMGMGYLDLSPIILFLLIHLARLFIAQISYSMMGGMRL